VVGLFVPLVVLVSAVVSACAGLTLTASVVALRTP
jgi:hypothetical protein